MTASASAAELPVAADAMNQEAQRQLALASLPVYSARVVLREKLKDPEVTASGATIYSELIHFEDSDGRHIIREATSGEPNPKLGTGRISPVPIMEGDAWLTGPNGINAQKIEAYLASGFPVRWLHHGSRHTAVGPDKSVSRSAHQMHAWLRDAPQADSDGLVRVIRNGLSRDGMTAEKFIALAPLYGHEVVFSDVEAPCFAVDMPGYEKAWTLATQLPREVFGIAHLGHKVLEQAIQQRKPELLKELAGTFDLHPKNVAQEVLWAVALINSSVGRYINAQPANTTGVRTFFTRDRMSQASHYAQFYGQSHGLMIRKEKGPHVAGAWPGYLEKKYHRLGKLIDYMAAHDMDLSGVTAADVVPMPSNGPKHWWQRAAVA